MIKSRREACLACESSILDLAVTSAHVGLSLITIGNTTLSVISPVSAISCSLSVTHSGQQSQRFQPGLPAFHTLD